MCRIRSTRIRIGPCCSGRAAGKLRMADVLRVPLKNGNEVRPVSGRKDILSGAVFAVFDGLYLYFCGDIEPFVGKGTTPLNNQFIPYFWGGFMLLLSVMLIVRGLRQSRRAAGRRQTEAAPEKGSAGMAAANWICGNREVILSFAVLFLYILLLGRVGFVIMTALFLTAEILILTPREKRRYAAAAAAGIIVSALLYFIFGRTLHILLPAGIFSF